MQGKKPFRGTRAWKLYKAGMTTGSDYYFLETYRSGTARACPQPLKPLLVQDDPVARVSYRASKGGNITTYLIRASVEELALIARQSGREMEIRKIEQMPEQIDTDYNILTTHIPLDRFHNGLRESLLSAIRHDVAEFCNFKPSKRSQQAGATLVERVSTPSEFNLRKPGSHSIVKEGKGRYHDICLLEIGLDFSKGCAATITVDGKYDPSERCSYCYAYQNGPSFLDTVFKFDEEYIINRITEKAEDLGLGGKPLIIRLGQTTDCFVPPALSVIKGAPDNLKTTLRALARLRERQPIAAALPTKFPQYSPHIADLLKAANVSLLVSIAYSQLEPGVLAHGFTVERRCDEALAFADAGVNTSLYVATDLTRPISEIQLDARKAYDFFHAHNPPLKLQFLDMRITKRDDAQIIGGASWDELKRPAIGDPVQGRLFAPPGRWQLTGQTYLAAATTHPDFLDITGKNNGDVRLCSTHVPSDQRCGGCFMKAKRTLSAEKS